MRRNANRGKEYITSGLQAPLEMLFNANQASDEYEDGV